MRSLSVSLTHEELSDDEDLVKSPKGLEDIAYAEVDIPEDTSGSCFSWKLLWAYTGPGWLMSIAYLDPGNLESDLQAGAYTGFELIWVLFWATVIGFALQVLAARLGTVTGKNLAEVCREEYPRCVSLGLWLMTELAIIGSDIQEVVGSAIALKILFGLPLWAGALLTGLDTFTFLLIHYFGVRKLEFVFALLILFMCACFFLVFGYSNPSFSNIMQGFVPGASDYAVEQAVGIIGAVIMPHNIYLHSALVQSRKVNRKSAVKVAEANKYFAIEAAIALFVSFLINLAVVAVFSEAFFSNEAPLFCASNGQAIDRGVDPPVCTSIGLQEAGDSLKGVFGNNARIIWAVGVLAAGQSSTMTGTFAGQFVMEGFLDIKIAIWKRVALTRGIALIPAVAVALVADNNKGKGGDALDEWLNVLQSIMLPFALIPVLHLTSRRSIMGQFRNGVVAQLGGWTLSVAVIAVNVYIVVDSMKNDDIATPHTWWWYTIVGVVAVAYFGFIAVLIRPDIRRLIRYVKFLKSSDETPQYESTLLNAQETEPSQRSRSFRNSGM